MIKEYPTSSGSGIEIEIIDRHFSDNRYGINKIKRSGREVAEIISKQSHIFIQSFLKELKKKGVEIIKQNKR